MIKNRIVLALLAGVSLWGSTYDVVQAEDKKFTVGFSLPSFQFTYGNALVRGATDEANKVGATLIALDGKNDSAKQANDLDDLVAQGVDGILYHPIDSAVAPQLAAKIAAAGVPVVAVSDQVGDPSTVALKEVPDTVVALVTHDNEASGRLAAEEAVRLFPKDRKAKVAIVEGAAGYSVTLQRKDGFTKGLQDLNADYDLVASQPGNWVADKSEAVCSNMLTATPDIDVIFASSGDMAVGCSRAVKAAGASAKIIGLDGNSPEIEAIKAGDIAATICNRPEDMGREAFRVLYEQLTGKQSRKAELDVVPTFIVTKDTADKCEPQF